LWDPRDRLRPHREPDIRRIDLAGAALDVIAWGGDPRTFEWFEVPPRDAVDAALALLERLELVAANGRLTAVGDRVRRMPLHPRLARMLVAAGGARAMAQACALLSERHLLPPRTAATTSDLLSAIDRWSDMPPRVRQAAAEIHSTFQSAISNQRSAMGGGEAAFRRAVLSGYPDRVAQRRGVGSQDVLLASGTGATIARESGVHDGEFLVALEVTNVARRQQPDVALIRVASRVEREWLQPTATETIHRFDAGTGRVKAVVVERYDALVLAERPTAADPEAAARILADAWLTRGPSPADEQLLRRLRFAGGDVDLAPMIRTAAYGARSLDEVTLHSALTPAVLRDLDRDAPESLAVPSGRTARLEYNDDGTVSASVKLQELFGLGDTPRIGRRKEPVVLSLLAPNGRPVQITRDLRSFWNNTYPEVRKELRGRYPKHPWPDDPWSATPTHRTRRRT
jgi:ATP-dependent helicase HrpB